MPLIPVRLPRVIKIRPIRCRVGVDRNKIARDLFAVGKPEGPGNIIAVRSDSRGREKLWYNEEVREQIRSFVIIISLNQRMQRRVDFLDRLFFNAYKLSAQQIPVLFTRPRHYKAVGCSRKSD